MQNNYVFISADMQFLQSYREPVTFTITGQEELINALARVTKDNELFFTSLSGLYMNLPPEFYKGKNNSRIEKKDLAKVPTVAFLNLSIAASYIKKEIRNIKENFPTVVFVLYGDEKEYTKFFKDLSENEAARFRQFYTLAKSGRKNNSKEVRKILDKAIMAVSNKTRLSKSFSAFISYSREDEEFARWLYRELNQAGVKCWIDEKKPPGENGTPADSVIYEHDKIILCGSKHSLKSRWIENEINSILAQEQELRKKSGKKILSLIPVDLDGFIFSEDCRWKEEITSRSVPDFTDWNPHKNYKGKGFQKLMDALIKAR